METNSPEIQELITVIRREHRRTQLIFGVSIIILCLVIMFIAPSVIRLQSENNQNGGAGALMQNVVHEPAAPITGTSSEQ